MGNFCTPSQGNDKFCDDQGQRIVGDKKEFIKRKREKRRRLIAEFSKTEETYLIGLKRLKSEWIEPLGKIPYIRNNYKSLWSNIDAILMLHSTILPELSEEPDKAGSVIFKHADWFKVYVQFITQYPNILQSLDEAQKKNKAVRKFFEKKNSAGLSVSSLLITPIQRIPRYSLLLKELVEVGNQLGSQGDKVEHESEIQAKLKIDEIAAHLNESKRAIENSTKFLEVSNRVRGRGNSLWKPSRRYIDEHEFIMFNRGMFGIRKGYTLFLFSDCLILVNQFGKFKREFSLKYLQKVEVVNSENKHGIFLEEVNDKGESKPIATLWTSDVETAEEWAKKIVQARDEVTSMYKVTSGYMALQQIPAFLQQNPEYYGNNCSYLIIPGDEPGISRIVTQYGSPTGSANSSEVEEETLKDETVSELKNLVRKLPPVPKSPPPLPPSIAATN